MIKSFRHDGLQRFFKTGSKAGIQPNHAKKLRLLLARLDTWIITEEITMTRMHNPPHPGEVLQDGVLGGELTVTEFAKRLRVSRVALSRVLNGHAAVSAELAIRLAAALGGSAESWLSMQAAYDLWHAAKKRRPKIQRIESAHLERAAAA